MAGSAWAINEDDGAPAYHAGQLRRLFTGLLFPGHGDRLGARQGVRPGGDPVVELSGTTWIVRAHQGVLYPGVTSSSGAYIYELEEESGSLDPADGSNIRHDIIVVGVEDHDEDASGEREVFGGYVAGAPGSGVPSTPAGTMRVATVTVPASGQGSPTLEYDAPFMAAVGGELPVADEAAFPTAGLYDGVRLWDIDRGQRVVRRGGSWRRADDWYDLGEFDYQAGDGSLLFTSIPTDAVALRVEGVFKIEGSGADNPAVGLGRLRFRVNGDTANYRYMIRDSTEDTIAAAASSTDSVQFGYAPDDDSSDNFQGEAWFEIEQGAPHGRSMGRSEGWAQPGAITSRWRWRTTAFRLAAGAHIPVTSILIYAHPNDADGRLKASATSARLLAKF